MAMTLSYLDEKSLSSLQTLDKDPTLKSTQSLTKLAARLAHDLNLPLASISAYAEELIDLAKERYGIEGFKQLVEYIEIIQKEADHCKEIVEKMLGYAKGLEINLETVSLHGLINECLDNFRSTVKEKHIAIKTDFEPKLHNITTDPTGLRQVMMNVLSNAGDAIADKGRITVRTKSHDGSVLIEISDNGIGIDHAYLQKIFDPFFTTKKPGKGTGLGLAICDGIMQTLKGKIAVRSQKNKGTTVTLILPKKIKVILT